MKTPKIVEGLSSNYELFQFYKENRKLKTNSHINELITSVKKWGVLRKIIVVKDRGLFYIIDGQHLFSALKALKLPIPYYEVKLTDKKDVVDLMSVLNNTQKGWSVFDYARLYSFAGRSAYTTLLEKYAEFNCLLPFGVIVHIYTGIVYGKQYRNGSAKIRNLSRGNKISKYLMDIVSSAETRIPRGHTIHRLITVTSSSEYDHKKFMKGLECWMKSHPDVAIPYRSEEVLTWVGIIMEEA
jgi:hypothetical protein